MIEIIRHTKDEKLLRQLRDRCTLHAAKPIDYAGLAVIKPWGYEFQVFATKECAVWVLYLKPGASSSLHCHPNKDSMFIPLVGRATFRTLTTTFPLDRCISTERGVFHAQENNTDDDVLYLEYEWPNIKTDIVRYQDRYGREGKGYEGRDAMVPLLEFIADLPILLHPILGAFRCPTSKDTGSPVSTFGTQSNTNGMSKPTPKRSPNTVPSS